MRKTRGTVRAALAALLLAALGTVSAATYSPVAPDPQRPVDLRNKDNFRSGSELVTTAVTVRDAAGRLVTTLEQKDFNVEEDGVQQPIDPDFFRIVRVHA